MSINVTATDVKKLREATDAPLMDCKAALVESGNDFDKAKQILREKGKMVAAKRADRSTTAGVVAISISKDLKRCSGVILESETDFVSKNDEFAKVTQHISDIFLDNDLNSDPLNTSQNGRTVKSHIDELVGKMRENIQLKQPFQMHSEEDTFGIYVHYDNTKGAVVKLQGNATGLNEVGRILAVQCVAFAPNYVKKEDVPQDIIAKELEIETERAINEGKNSEIAANIAKGRINKEFYQTQVLLEQPFYKDPSKKTVAQYIQEEAKARGGEIKVLEFKRLAVGEN